MMSFEAGWLGAYFLDLTAAPMVEVGLMKF